jgi:hypothetical protein
VALGGWCSGGLRQRIADGDVLAGRPTVARARCFAGAFTALYGTTMPLRDRLRVLSLVAVGIVAASVLGVLCAANAWLTITCMTAVALLASMLVVTTGLGPPGPMQFVLVAGVSARLADPDHLSGASLNPMLIPQPVDI